jgi:hypothetical protein
MSEPWHLGHVGSIDFVVNFLPHSRQTTLNPVLAVMFALSLFCVSEFGNDGVHNLGVTVPILG